MLQEVWRVGPAQPCGRPRRPAHSTRSGRRELKHRNVLECEARGREGAYAWKVKEGGAQRGLADTPAWSISCPGGRAALASLIE